MKRYKVVITELVQHSLIDREINRMCFVVRNTETSGQIIKRSIEGNEMTVYSGYKETPLLKISFDEISI